MPSQHTTVKHCNLTSKFNRYSPEGKRLINHTAQLTLAEFCRFRNANIVNVADGTSDGRESHTAGLVVYDAVYSFYVTTN